MKLIKEILCFPFYMIFLCGCCVAIIGWMGIEGISGERFKQITIER